MLTKQSFEYGLASHRASLQGENVLISLHEFAPLNGYIFPRMAIRLKID